MISPSYSLTATERVLPNMALDFTTASLDSRVTLTRTGNTATVTNSSGVIAAINANLPRFDFNPTTLVCNGLLIEEARTNLILYSEQFDNALWNKTDTTITANSIIAPSNALTAELATEGSAGSSNVAQAITIVANSTNTFSVFLKRGNTDWVRFVIWDSVNNANRISAWVNLSTGALGATVVNGGTSTGGVATTTNYGNGWYRVTLSGAVNNAAILLNCLFSSAASDGVVTRVSGATYYAWGAQTESGAFATSYIPTVASTVTRTADVAVMTGTNFSSWYNATQGSFMYQFNNTLSVGNRFLGGPSNTSTSNRISTFYNGTPTLIYEQVIDTSAQASLFGAGTPPPTIGVQKTCLTYKQNDFAAAFNGAAALTDTSGTVPTLNQMDIGSLLGASQFLNSHVQKISYWPQRLTNNEIQAFSK